MKRILVLLALVVAGSAARAQHPLPEYSYLEIYDLATRTHRVPGSLR